VLQFGFAAESSAGNGEAISVDADKLMQGSVYQGVMKSGTRKFLTMLSTTSHSSQLVLL
jgi:hypothetical protein